MRLKNPLYFRSRAAFLALLVACALAGLAAPGAAQVLDANIDVAAEEFSGEATPEGTPATTNLTVSYDCGGLSGETSITAIVDENVSGASAELDPSVITPQEPPDCTPGERQTSVHTLTVSADKTVPAGTDVPITIRVAGKNVLTTDQPGQNEVAATVGPYVAVTFTPKTDAYEVPAGESTTVVIDVTTDSNVQVMVMPTVVESPEGWQADLFPINIESPLAGGNGSQVMEFEIIVPEDAQVGDNQVVVELFAHSVADYTYVKSETERITLTVSVLPPPTSGDDTEEGPGLAPFPLALLGLAGVALLRRRLTP